MTYNVYILRSLKDQKYYIGQTSNVDKRLLRHNNGMVPSTKPRRPFVLVMQENFTTRSEAMLREKYLKSLHGSTVFRKIIGETQDSL